MKQMIESRETDLTSTTNSSVRAVRSSLSQSGNIRLRDSRGRTTKIIETSELGKGQYGTVKTALCSKSIERKHRVRAIKIKEDFKTDPSEYIFYQYVRDNGLAERLLVPFMNQIDTQYGMNYQHMQKCDFGDGNQLIKLLKNLTQAQGQLIKRHVFYSLISTYSLMHSYGIMHMDLKPANILFDEKGNCLVCDFDLSIIITERGEYFRRPQKLQCDQAFVPTNFKGVNLEFPEKRLHTLSSLDAYRLGLTCLLIYCEIDEEKAKKMDFTQIKASDLKRLVEEHKVPDFASNIISGLLVRDATKRWTPEQARVQAQGFALNSTEHQQVQTIFSNVVIAKKIDHLKTLRTKIHERSRLNQGGESKAVTETNSTSRGYDFRCETVPQVNNFLDKNNRESTGRFFSSQPKSVSDHQRPQATKPDFGFICKDQDGNVFSVTKEELGYTWNGP